MPISPLNDNSTFLTWKNITNELITSAGDVTTLPTTDKTSTVAAIIEIFAALGDTDLSSLTTDDNSNIINALNSIVTDLGDIDTLSTVASDVVGAIEEVKAGTLDFQNQIGIVTLLTNYDVGVIDSTVEAINDVILKAGDLTTLSTTDKTSLVAAINELFTLLGDLSNLNTTDKSSYVASINEVLGNVGDITTLTTTAQTSAVAAINEVDAANTATDTKIGTLASLTTEDKTDIVLAVNELHADALIIPTDNVQDFNGTFASDAVRTSKLVTTFDATNYFGFVGYNSNVIAAGDRVFTDSSTFGGAGTAQTSEGASLVTALTRTSNTNIAEFFMMNNVMGSGVADSITFNATTYYPAIESINLLGQEGRKLTATFWLKTVSGSVVVGNDSTDLWIDGVKNATDGELIVDVDGWTHIRMVKTLTAETEQFFPCIYALDTSEFNIALLGVYKGFADLGMHKGILI